MAWTLGNKRLYVQETKESAKQIIPRLQPLAAGTIMQFFGWESPILVSQAIVIGRENVLHFQSLTMSGVAFEFVSPEGSLGNYNVSNVAFSRMPVICQTIDTTLPEDSPVYMMDVELYEET